MEKVAYKLLRIDKHNNLHPLYVNSKETIELNKWLNATEGERLDNGKVKSKLGQLKYRPGWHLSTIPLATHIGIKDNGKVRWQHPDTVWCECVYNNNISYQLEADRRGSINGKFYSNKADLDYIPVNGYYFYKTNPAMTGNWIIAGEMKVNRILTNEEVADICNKNGVDAQEVYNGF